jgi:hypothetical protein
LHHQGVWFLIGSNGKAAQYGAVAFWIVEEEMVFGSLLELERLIKHAWESRVEAEVSLAYDYRYSQTQSRHLDQIDTVY